MSKVDTKSKSPTDRRGSVYEDVYRRLRSDIVHGVLRPNEPLIETELAERLSVSRTPVRAALTRLATDGLLVGRRRGWAVYEFTAREIQEIYETRAALEGYAARLAAGRAADEELSKVAVVLRESEDILEASPERLVEVNDAFHDAVIAASGNRRIEAMIQRNRLYYFNYNVASLYAPEEVAASRAQHEELMSALLTRDAHRAEEITREHVNGALAAILAKVR